MSTLAWRIAHPEKVKIYARRARCLHRYGITQEAKEQLIRRQGKRCAICRTKQPGGHGWHIDHDHRTKRVRGVLCTNCNTGLGLLKDDPKLVRAALAYLKRHAVVQTRPTGD